MGSKSNSQVRAAWIGGLCLIVASVLAALIALRPWSKSSPQVKKVGLSKIVSGTAVNSSDNESLALVKVSVIGRTEVATTEQNGNFWIRLPDSIESVRLHLSKEGFKTVDVTTSVPTNGLIVPLAVK